MLSRLASWMVLGDGDMLHDAGVEKPTYRKAIVLGCGAVIIICAGSYTVYKYRHDIQAFLNRLYASTSQYMRVYLGKNDSAAPAPSNSQEEANKETGANDNSATGETQLNAAGDVEDGEYSDGAIPFQVDELLMIDVLVANGMGDIMHGGYNPGTGDLGFPFGPFQQVDGGGAGRGLGLYDAGPSIVDVTPGEQAGEEKTAPTQDNSDETPQLVDGGDGAEENDAQANDTKENESQKQVGDEHIDD